PGTGKTRTLTARIAWLIESGKAIPSDITALTFTNKAAREMRERVERIIGKSSKIPKITTFHAIGAEILKKDGSSTKLLDDRQRSDIIRALPKPNTLKGLSLRELSLLISNSKTSNFDDPVSPSFPRRRESSDKSVAVGDPIYKYLQKYETALSNRGLHD